MSVNLQDISLYPVENYRFHWDSSPFATSLGDNYIGIEGRFIISRKSGQKIPKIANLQYYKSKANYGTKKKGISR